MDEAIDQGGDAGRGGEDLAPFGERAIGRHQGALVLIAARDELEQQIGMAVRVGEISNLVDDQECRVDVVAQPAPQGGVAVEGGEIAEHLPGACEHDGVALDPYPLIEQVAVKAGKTPYVRFDLNDYSIPHTHVQRTLTLLADVEEVRILDGHTLLARHIRCYARGAQIEDPAHIAALIADKHAARRQRATNHLATAAPASATLLGHAAERGDNLGSITASLMQLLARYGAAELQDAILEALESDVPHPNTVRLILERRREQRQAPPPIAVALPEHVRAKDAPVISHRLDTYDKLKETPDED